MSQPYVGEIRLFAGNFAPAGWMFCRGQALPISEHEVLFQLIGTTYGGDGEETFSLPNLQGRTPVHQGTGAGGTYQVGESAGIEEVTLTVQQIPYHTHNMIASNDIPTGSSPSGNITGQAAAKLYRAGTPALVMASDAVLPVGGSQPHENMQPYLCLSYIISLYGTYPSQT